MTTITNNPDDGNWCRRCFRGWKVGQTEGLPGPALQSSSSSSSFPHSYCRIFCHRHRNPHNLPCHQHLLCHHLTLIIACTTSPSYIHKTGTQSSQLPLPAIPGCSESINEKKEKCEKENKSTIRSFEQALSSLYRRKKSKIMLSPSILL